MLFQPGNVVELRALDVSGKTVAGYFDDHAKLAEAAAKLSGQAAGVYAVLNELTSDLLARSANRVTVGPKNLTQDPNITRRRYLSVDIDAKRKCAWQRYIQPVCKKCGCKGMRAWVSKDNR